MNAFDSTGHYTTIILEHLSHVENISATPQSPRPRRLQNELFCTSVSPVESKVIIDDVLSYSILIKSFLVYTYNEREHKMMYFLLFNCVINS